MKRTVYIVSGAGFAVMLVVWGFIWLKESRRALDQVNTTPNRVRSYGTEKSVTDIRIGWCNNDGRIIESNLFTDSLTVTVFLQNFDGWLLSKARVDQRLLPEDLKPEELRNYSSLVDLRKSSRLSAEQEMALQPLQVKVNHW